LATKPPTHLDGIINALAAVPVTVGVHLVLVVLVDTVVTEAVTTSASVTELATIPDVYVYGWGHSEY
jgi:hypothetical protein